jgi:hypothetical protein
MNPTAPTSIADASPTNFSNSARVLVGNPKQGVRGGQVTIKAIGDFDDNQLAELASLTRYSPVRDIVSKAVPIAIDLTRA